MSGLSSLTAGQYLKVNSAGNGFELSDRQHQPGAERSHRCGPDHGANSKRPTSIRQIKLGAVAHSINSNTDVDTSTSAPTTGQIYPGTDQVGAGRSISSWDAKSLGNS